MKTVYSKKCTVSALVFAFSYLIGLFANGLHYLLLSGYWGLVELVRQPQGLFLLMEIAIILAFSTIAAVGLFLVVVGPALGLLR